MLLGYNTNGLAHHDLLEAIDLLADIGYRGVAITLDHTALNPYATDLSEQIKRVRDRLQTRGMANVIETGARFLLDPRTKHEPTLVTASEAGRKKRIDFYRRAMDIAIELKSGCVSIWSGVVRDVANDEAILERLAGGLRAVLDHADNSRCFVAFEPEPGMFIDTMASWQRLLQWVDSPSLELTMDVGHLYCQGEVPIADQIHRWGPRLANVHIEDMKAGVHEHLMFGEGEMSFPPIIQALANANYRGGIHVELSRHSHEGPTAAKKAYDFLMPLIATATAG